MAHLHIKTGDKCNTTMYEVALDGTLIRSTNTNRVACDVGQFIRRHTPQDVKNQILDWLLLDMFNQDSEESIRLDVVKRELKDLGLMK